MRHYFISLIFIFCSLTAISQVSIKATSLTNTDAGLLYVGVNNVLKVEGVDNLPVQLISRKNAVKAISDNGFILQASNLGVDTISVLKNGKEVFNKVFEVSLISDPVARIGNLKSDAAVVSEILSDPSLNIFLPNCNYFNPFTVSGFSGTFITQNGKTVTAFKSETNKFLNDQVNMIKELKPGDKIYIHKIVVKGPDAAKRMLRSALTVTIQ